MKRLTRALAVTALAAFVAAVTGYALYTGGFAFGLPVFLIVVLEALLLAAVGRRIEARMKARADRREMARRRRLAPLPHRWEVPDYPPDDLQPPAS